MKQFKCRFVKSFSLIVLTFGFKVFLISDPTTESISLGVKGDACDRLSNDNRRLLKGRRWRRLSRVSIGANVFGWLFTQHRAKVIVDSGLSSSMLKSLCTEPAGGKFFNASQNFLIARNDLKCVSRCRSGNMKIRKVVRLCWLDHTWNGIVKINYTLEAVLIAHHSFHCRFSLTKAIFYDYNTVYDQIDRTAFQLATPSKRELVKVDCFCSRTLQGSPSERCQLCYPALTRTRL